ncbi:MAG: UDP-N-acetylmuramate dehydrogenase [Desulfopila sp.]
MTPSSAAVTAQLRLRLVAMLPGELVRFDEPMARHTSFRIGGPADVFLTPRSYDELALCLRAVTSIDLPYFLLGGGTNILVADRGVRGVVITTAGLDRIEVAGETLAVQAGARVTDVCRAAAEHDLAGLEFINGMPGTIGGAVWMNARCYGHAIGDVLSRVEVLADDLTLATVSCDPGQFSYKHSPFQAMTGCICQVWLDLTRGDRRTIRRTMAENHRDRVAKGHFQAPSAGSLFKNNRQFGAPTGKIIDELGLRGATVGGAAIAPFHGNIFINQDNASAADMLALIRLTMETVAERCRIRLEPEVRLVGEWLPEELAFLSA